MSDKQGESENRTYRGFNERWKTRQESEVREEVSESMGVEVSTAPTVRLMVGHVLDKLRELPDSSVHCVVTSPPYRIGVYGTTRDADALIHSAK